MQQYGRIDAGTEIEMQTCCNTSVERKSPYWANSTNDFVPVARNSKGTIGPEPSRLNILKQAIPE
jgi:hypothetical protein